MSLHEYKFDFEKEFAYTQVSCNDSGCLDEDCDSLVQEEVDRGDDSPICDCGPAPDAVSHEETINRQIIEANHQGNLLKFIN